MLAPEHGRGMGPGAAARRGCRVGAFDGPEYNPVGAVADSDPATRLQLPDQLAMAALPVGRPLAAAST